jgi:hypothetical protein
MRFLRQSSIPDLQLSHGQMLWAVALGQEPSAEARDRARYLRLLGIPRPPSGEGPGSGQRIVYGFDDLVLVGLGMLALSHGYPPRTMKDVLVDQRSQILKEIHTAWLELPADVVEDPVSTSRGKRGVLYEPEYYVSLSGLGRGKPVTLDFIQTSDNPLQPVQIIPGEAPKALFPLKHWMPQWVAWALQAPKRTRGPKV